jgi:hypothetical protein
MRRVEPTAQRAEQERWDLQLDRDASSGKLDFLQDEARRERDNGTLQAWPLEGELPIRRAR